jgi:hypothetical protein
MENTTKRKVKKKISSEEIILEKKIIDNEKENKKEKNDIFFFLVYFWKLIEKIFSFVSETYLYSNFSFFSIDVDKKNSKKNFLKFINEKINLKKFLNLNDYKKNFNLVLKNEINEKIKKNEVNLKIEEEDEQKNLNFFVEIYFYIKNFSKFYFYFKNSSLVISFLKIFGKRYFFFSIFRIISDLLYLMQPIYLNFFLFYAEKFYDVSYNEDNENYFFNCKFKIVFSSFFIFFVLTISEMLNSNFFFEINKIAEANKNILTNLIFKKILKLNNSQKSKFSTSKILNTITQGLKKKNKKFKKIKKKKI